MVLSTRRLHTVATLVLFAAVAAWLLADGLPADRVLVSTEALEHSLPWSAVLEDEPAHNRFLGDQTRIYYPYLEEAARVYRGESDPLWTSRGGGGQPFLGNATSSLLHPLTLLAAVLPTERVPLAQGLLVLAGSAAFTFLFLRRLGLSWAASVLGAVAFGFGGHQVLWLQYALSHTLLALPFCFWAVELVREDRSRRRVAVLALGFAAFPLGGHPETAYVAAAVAGTWALWRLWDAHGRTLVLGVVVLALLVSAIQWWPFLDYALVSHGMELRRRHAEGGVVPLGASLVFALFFWAGFTLVRGTGPAGVTRRVGAVLVCALVLTMARRMGFDISSLTMLLPDMYGSPLEGGRYTGAQDYPGLNAGFSGALPALLLVLGATCGVGGGFGRFFGWGSLLLWGAAHHLPGAELLVRSLPGASQLEPTRLLGPVSFLAACGGAIVIDHLCLAPVKPQGLRAMRWVAGCLVAMAGLGVLLCRLPVDPFSGHTLVAGLESPPPYWTTDGNEVMDIAMHLEAPAHEVIVEIDGRIVHRGEGHAGDQPILTYPTRRTEEGVHRIVVVARRGERMDVVADQPFVVKRDNQLATRDGIMLLLALALMTRVLWRPGARLVPVAAGLVVLDVLSFGAGYNAASPVERLFPPTRTEAFLRAQPPPFRIFTEGTIVPPDTQFTMGVDHLMSYDNLGYHAAFQWRLVVLDPDAFASFSFSRETVRYDSPFFDALDVRYVLTAPTTDLSDVPGFVLAHESETRVWENTRNLGRAFVVGRVADMRHDRVEDLERTDPAHAAFLESEGPGALGGAGTARVRAHDGARVLVDVEADGPALLVLAENWAEGWVASIDGGPAQPTTRCDVTWQCVPIDAATQEVEFRYRPRPVHRGALVSVATALLLLLMIVLPRQLRGG